MTFENQILFPVVVQDRVTRQVLMLAYANQEALELTESTRLAHFFSRSRHRLWQKGETSGHRLHVRQILSDCDQDAYVYLVDAEGPACHRNTFSCFGDGLRELPDPMMFLQDIVNERLRDPRDGTSYTQSLADGPLSRLIQKVGEEAIEVVIAACNIDGLDELKKEALVDELADLFYHLVVLIGRFDISLDEVSLTLLERHHGLPR